ncbi:MAG: putative 7-carboxy-7-deazaguanine synthase QueE [Paludibacteraceae bacterium]|nr:putative 7-carboxy-7-deazaguanine synthase QueE [Paludibacteraceae bacterium]
MKVIEKFISIDGEGPTAGALSVFIRFAGCNLRCAWCDTSYAWEAKEVNCTDMSAAEIADYIKSTGMTHVTLTGGEPLLQPGLIGLLSRLADYQVHIETNGAIPIEQFRIGSNIHFVVDYKLPDSGMEDRMYTPNLASVRKTDAYKFVIASESDLNRAVEIVGKYNLDTLTQVYFSTVFGKMEPATVVERMKIEKLCNIKLQLQMHKYIWEPNKRGV